MNSFKKLFKNLFSCKKESLLNHSLMADSAAIMGMDQELKYLVCIRRYEDKPHIVFYRVNKKECSPVLTEESYETAIPLQTVYDAINQNGWAIGVPPLDKKVALNTYKSKCPNLHIDGLKVYCKTKISCKECTGDCNYMHDFEAKLRSLQAKNRTTRKKKTNHESTKEGKS